MAPAHDNEQFLISEMREGQVWGHLFPGFRCSYGYLEETGRPLAEVSVVLLEPKYPLLRPGVRDDGHEIKSWEKSNDCFLPKRGQYGIGRTYSAYPDSQYGRGLMGRHQSQEGVYLFIGAFGDEPTFKTSVRTCAPMKGDNGEIPFGEVQVWVGDHFVKFDKWREVTFEGGVILGPNSSKGIVYVAPIAEIVKGSLAWGEMTKALKAK